MPSDDRRGSDSGQDRQAEWRGKVMALLDSVHERLGEDRETNASEHREIRIAIEEIRGLISDNRAAIAVLQVKAGLVGLIGGLIPAAGAVLIVLLKGWGG